MFLVNLSLCEITCDRYIFPFIISHLSMIRSNPNTDSVITTNDAIPTVTTKEALHPTVLKGHIPVPQPLKQQPNFDAITILTLMVMSSPHILEMFYSSHCVACR